MNPRPRIVLGISPGTRSLGYAVIQDRALRDWGVKGFKGPWSRAKQQRILQAVSALAATYLPAVVTVKKLSLPRSTPDLQRLIKRMATLLQQEGFLVETSSLQRLKTGLSLSKTRNKGDIARAMTGRFPILLHEFQKEQAGRHPYRKRMFEAVALAAVAADRLDKRK